jgi:hypothetical protein
MRLGSSVALQGVVIDHRDAIIACMSYTPFRDSSSLLNDPEKLRTRMSEDGYLFMRGVAPKEDVLAARRDVLNLCKDAGWIDPSDIMGG